MRLTENIKELNKNDISLAGGKGAALGELIKAGIPVPAGFVVISEVFEKTLEKNRLTAKIDLILHNLDYKNINAVNIASAKIKKLIINAQIPQNIITEIKDSFKNLKTKYVAIRSSATVEDSSVAAWAGQLESHLNTTKDNLLVNIKNAGRRFFRQELFFTDSKKERLDKKLRLP